MRTRQLAQVIVAWYRQHKREMPWRGESDPYKIWLSEVILQQTRVAQGTPYYLHFISAYPRVTDLANASEESVLKSWEGLGYYSRARNLHKAAKMVANELEGNFPKNYSDLLTLPGVGPYTAAAIASICYDERVPVVDGNVNRVVTRAAGILDAIDSSQGKKAIQKIVEEAISTADSAAEFNQAMMEFGALQCTPKSPDCAACPIAEGCFALREGKIQDLPLKKGKTKVRNRFITYYVITDQGHTYIRQRNEKGIWQGLFEFVSKEHPTTKAAKESLSAEVGDTYTYVHVLSHQKIHAQFVVCALGNAPADLSDYKRIAFEQLSDIPMARIHTRFLDEHGASVLMI